MAQMATKTILCINNGEMFIPIWSLERYDLDNGNPISKKLIEKPNRNKISPENWIAKRYIHNIGAESIAYIAYFVHVSSNFVYSVLGIWVI